MKTYWRGNQFIAIVGVTEIVLATIFGDSVFTTYIHYSKKEQIRRPFFDIEEAKTFVEDEIGICRWSGNKYLRGKVVLAEFRPSESLESYFEVFIHGATKQPSRVFFTDEDAINFIEKKIV